MGRWEPNTRARLERAAMELYLERGFDQATVADIAARAGLAERTFFRHFADKREVLFGGSAALRALLVEQVVAAPATDGPLDAVARALDAAGAVLQGNHDRSRQRQEVIAANPLLQERELIKLAALAAAIAQTLRGRGVPEPTASLTAEAGIAVFKVAFEGWVGGTGDRDLQAYLRESLDQLRSLTAP